MSKPRFSSALRCNPQRGTLPTLQFCTPDQLLIDETYQRTLDSSNSQYLIRRIASNWDWGLCQPLFVARRPDGALYVVDGQHRLAAAKLRGDIWQLPCVISSFESSASEAASFVALNQQRRPLSQLELFRAALAAGEQEAHQILAAIDGAGLTLAKTSNNVCERSAVGNIGSLRTCYRRHGRGVVEASLRVLAAAFPGHVLRYAGSIFIGIYPIVADELANDPAFVTSELFTLMAEMLGGVDQIQWYKDICAETVKDPTASRNLITGRVFRAAWAECTQAMLEDAA